MARLRVTSRALGTPALAWAGAHAHHLALIAVTAVGLLLRFYQLGDESYWFDEIYTLYDAGLGVGRDWTRVTLSLSNTGYIALAAAWIRVVGTGEAATRALSALCGTGCLVVMYRLGREWVDRRTGVLAMALMAVSEFQIHYAQDLRFYTPLLLVSLLSFLYFRRAVRGGGVGAHLLYALFALLGVYTHTHAMFSLLAQGLYYALRWPAVGGEARRRLGLTLGAVALGTLPVLAVAARAALAGGAASALGWIEPPTVSLMARTVYWYVLPLRHERTWAAMALMAAGAGLLLVGGTIVHVRRIGVRPWLERLGALRAAPAALRRRGDTLALLVLWALAPIVTPFVLSQIIGPMYVERYTIAASPAWYLLLALLLARLRGIVPLAVTLAALLTLIVPGLVHYYAVDVKEQWREVAAHLAGEGRPGDVIVLAPEDQGWHLRALEWYYDGALPRCAIDVDLEGPEIAAALHACAAGHERAWVIMRGPRALLQRFEDVLLDDAQVGLRLAPGPRFVRIAVYLAEAGDP
jgi:mannosyltransferase